MLLLRHRLFWGIITIYPLQLSTSPIAWSFRCTLPILYKMLSQIHNIFSIQVLERFHYHFHSSTSRNSIIFSFQVFHQSHSSILLILLPFQAKYFVNSILFSIQVLHFTSSIIFSIQELQQSSQSSSPIP